MLRLAVAALLTAAIGCAGMGLPKALTQEGVSSQREQRKEDVRRHFDRQQDFAESADRADSAAAADSDDSAEIADENSAVELLHIGQAALADGATEAAGGYFRQAVAAKPDDPQIPISAAVAALRANRPAVAVELLTPAAKRFPSSAAIHRALGAAYYRSGDYKSSQVALRKALSLDNSNPLSYLLLGCTLAKLGQNEAAESHLRQARALDPRYTIVR